MTHDVATLKAAAKAHGQEHLFAFYDALDAPGQLRLLDQIASLDFALMDELLRCFVAHDPSGIGAPRKIDPAPIMTWPRTAAEKAAAQAARAAGEAALRAGRVGCFLWPAGRARAWA